MNRVLARESLTTPIGFVTKERADGLRRRFSAEVAALEKRADDALERRFRFFGYPEIMVAEGTEDVDPFTGLTWPRCHAKRLDYRAADTGDPKLAWELNRCQELPLLTAAWLIIGDDRYACGAVDGAIRWVGSHPPGRGIAWSNGFEAGIRAISLAVALDALRGSGFLDPPAEERLLRALWQHGRWIERDPSSGSSANNHRIGELVGLIAIGALAPELRIADTWLATASRELGEEAGKQVRPDGTDAEQAFSYHVFVIDLLLVGAAILECAGAAVPEQVTSAIARSGDALWAQLDDDEPPPAYGDSDDGRALVLDAADRRDPRGAAAGIAALVGHSGAARVAQHRLDPMGWWLFGAAGERRITSTGARPAPGSTTLPDAGLTVLRSGRCRAMVDHGDHGYLSLAAHGHADALCVDLSVGSHGLVVDPGVGSYFARPVLRRAFRGTGFHATVLVDDVDSSVPGGPFLWTRHANARLLVGDGTAGYVIAEHDGYHRLNDPVVHRRAVVDCGDESIVVVDRLHACGLHRYSQRWPLHPDLELERMTDVLVASGDGFGVAISVSASAPVTLDAVRGQLDPPAGWWSERLESVVPSWLVSVDLEAAGPVEIAALIVPFGAEGAPGIGVELDSNGSRTVIDLTGPSGARSLELDLAAPKPWLRLLSISGVE